MLANTFEAVFGGLEYGGRFCRGGRWLKLGITVGAFVFGGVGAQKQDNKP